jgi:hypothetical protein
MLAVGGTRLCASRPTISLIATSAAAAATDISAVRCGEATECGLLIVR